jgi:hypothetical protein
MNWPASANAALAQCLRDYIADSASPLRDVALKHQALPIFSGIGGMSLLAADGKVIDLDDSDQPTSWSDGEWTRLVYIRAAQRFPRLAMLLPGRPEAASACSECNGTGRFPKLPSALCGECSGLGWVTSAGTTPTVSGA